MFREPLAPTPQKFTLPVDKRFRVWQTEQTPFTRSPISSPQLDEHEIARLVNCINQSQNGLVILGRFDCQHQHSKSISEFLQKLNWPVYADIASGFRCGSPDWPLVEDKFVASEHYLKKWQPDTIVHLGGTFVSKRVQQWIERHPPQRYIHIHNNARRFDPGHVVTEKITSDVELFCSTLLDKIRIADRESRNGFSQNELENQLAKLTNTEELNEPIIAKLVSQYIPSHHGLFLGNSMPIRDMNMFADFNGPPVPVAGNRGASGIDGNIATALGFAHGLGPVTAILGDVAALHDLNSLYLMKNSPPVILIIINNNGGAIFSFLPISKYEQVFEKWFETPHGLSFEKAAELFKLPYARPASTPEFITCYENACAENASMIIEVKTDIKENVKLHQRINTLINHDFEKI